MDKQPISKINMEECSRLEKVDCFQGALLHPLFHAVVGVVLLTIFYNSLLTPFAMIPFFAASHLLLKFSGIRDLSSSWQAVAIGDDTARQYLIVQNAIGLKVAFSYVDGYWNSKSLGRITTGPLYEWLTAQMHRRGRLCR